MLGNPALAQQLAREAANMADRIEQRLQAEELSGRRTIPPDWSQPPRRDPSIPSTARYLDYHMGGQQLHLIHLESEEGDWLWVDPPDEVPTFESLDALRLYAMAAGLDVRDQYPGAYRVDLIVDWLKVRDVSHIECEPFLYCWQLFDNLAASVGVPLHSGDLNRLVYQHLWVGIYAIPQRVPRWRATELSYLSDHLQWGHESFQSHTRLVR